MLTREIMGALALGILWLNAGLVMAAAFKQLQGLRRLGRRLRAMADSGGLVHGEVVRAGEGDRFAVRRIHQLGRAVTSGGPPTMLFTDGPQSFEVLGGAVRTAEGDVEIAPADPVRSEVWHDAARGAEAVGGSAEAFDEALPAASKYKGFARDLEVEVRRGDRVWVVGARDGDALGAPEEAVPLLVSMVDPRAWIASRTRLVLGFVLASTTALVAVTALALWPPRFGLVSTIGGALGLVYFLAIQPLGTALRDALRTPARRLLNGEWRRGA